MTAKGFLSLLLFFSLSACSTISQKQSAAESSAIYSTEKAIESGRFDLAEKYNAQAARLATPPKKKPVVSPFVSQGKRYAVLPPAFNGTPTVAINSPAADTLIQQDKALQGQLNAEGKALEDTTKQADTVIAEKQKIVDKAETAKVIASHSFWGRVKFYGIIALIAAGLGALVYFFPPLLPILLSAANGLISLIRTLASGAYSFIAGLWSKYFKKGGS